MFFKRLFAVATLASATPVVHQAQFDTLFEVHNETFFENVLIGPNGHLLLSSSTMPSLLNVFSTDPIDIRPVVTIPDVNGTLGIDFVAPKHVAINAGKISLATQSFVEESGAVYVVNFAATPVDIRKAAAIPESQLLNGLAALPAHPHIVLSSDSRAGHVYRVNTLTGDVDIVMQGPEFGSGESELPIGVNGIRIRDDTLYFTNSGQGFFARVKISEMGEMVGPVEKIHQYPNSPPTLLYDDFTIDCDGNAYVAVHQNRLVKITPDGDQTIVLGGPNNNRVIGKPTSVALSLDQKSVFVVTDGTSKTVDGKFGGGQLLAVDIS
jgi:hypothetical protein